MMRTLTREQVVWVFRMVLGRDPENEQAIQAQLTDHRERADLILAAINSEEYRSRHPV